MTYKLTVHEFTKFSPNKLILGCEINSPLDVMGGQLSLAKSEQCYVQFVDWVLEATQRFYVVACEHSSKAVLRKKCNYDNYVLLNQLQEKDWVWYFYPQRQNKSWAVS